MGRSWSPARSFGGVRLIIAVAAALALSVVMVPGALAASRHSSHHVRAHHKRVLHARRFGELDCNGFSRKQHSIRAALACTDIRGLRGHTTDWTWNGRFFDNGHYIGHDEPDMTFLSSAPGSGNNVTWRETLPMDPTALPTVAHPGSDITHWFELSPAPWFSMAMCDSNAYPQLPCTPLSDENAPRSGVHAYPGAGGAFMEMQFYPPGMAPFADSVSCDNTHWCAALNIDSLECTLGFAHCNPACTEPVNFAFIQRDGVPTGPPNPQTANLSTFTQNSETLMMNPGDKLVVHMSDAPVPGQPGQHAFLVTIRDLTTGQSGFMQASAQNGFANTSIVDCSGTPHNFEPEYNTAAKGNITPWTALQANISTQYEIGHFEPCTSIEQQFTFHPSGGSIPDTFWNICSGPYESAGAPDTGGPETGDGFCYPAGDTHGGLGAAPNEVTGCEDNAFQNGDLDFDGTPYWADWPTSTTPGTFPSTFQQALPTTAERSYSGYFIQTDAALSESTCSAGGGTGAGCAVPPPNAPGAFYPYWTRTSGAYGCTIEFGNVATGQTFGKDAQYGTNQFTNIGYPEFEGPVHNNNSCT